MRIDPRGELYGVPALAVRDALRNLSDHGDWRYACRHIEPSKIKPLIDAMLADGLLQIEHTDEPDRLTKTAKGRRLAAASGRTIKRATADRMLADLVARAGAINGNDDFCYRVGVLVVFGSYLDETQHVLGDLDVGFTQLARYTRAGPADRSPMEDAERRSINRASAAGRRFGWWWDKDCWPEHEFLLALKAHKPGLSLHRLHEHSRDIVLGGPHKVVFGVMPATLGSAAVIDEDEAAIGATSPRMVSVAACPRHRAL